VRSVVAILISALLSRSVDGCVSNDSDGTSCSLSKPWLVEAMKPWIVFYDIRNDRNRTRIAKLLVAQGIRVQKSVFFLEASTRQIQMLVQRLARHADRETDCICAWPLASNWQVAQRCIPEAAQLTEVPFLVL